MAKDKGATVSIAGGYEICRVWSREGPLYVLDNAELGFFTQGEAENWAREHPKMAVLKKAVYEIR